MYNEKENDLFKQSRAIIDLHGFFVITEADFILENPKVIVNLLTIKEAVAFDSFDEQAIEDRLDIEDSIITNSIVSIVNYPKEVISLIRSPAGVISFIAEAVIKMSQSYTENPPAKFISVAESINFLEQMAAIISYYLNTPVDTVLGWPISQIYKRYAMCHKAFPNQVLALQEKEEEEE